MKRVRSLLAVLVIAASGHAATAERVFPESVLEKWGYKTTEVSEGRHAIRSLKNYGSSEVAFYARFHLKVRTFESEEEAKSEKRRIDSERKGHDPEKDKDYRQFLQKGRKVYVVNPTSNATRLRNQPDLMKKIGAYLEGKTP